MNMRFLKPNGIREVNNPPMKDVHKQRLYADLIRIADQIGILPEETPKLIFDRKEYHAMLVAEGQSKRAAYYGQCDWSLRTIFTDASRRTYSYCTYRKPKGDYLSATLMELMCDYFDAGYEVLYNYGVTDIRNADGLVNFIEDILRNDQKILVAIDNAHKEKTYSIFYFIDKVSNSQLTKKLKIIMTARCAASTHG